MAAKTVKRSRPKKKATAKKGRKQEAGEVALEEVAVIFSPRPNGRGLFFSGGMAAALLLTYEALAK
jgi:hypothetical protein